MGEEALKREDDANATVEQDPTRPQDATSSSLSELGTILLIGPRIRKTKIGGATVSFENLIASLTEAQAQIKIQDISYESYLEAASAFFQTLWALAFHPYSLVFVNLSKLGTRYILPFAIFFKKIRKSKKLIARFFGGDLDVYVNREFSERQRRKFFAQAPSVDLALLQTHNLMETYGELFGNSLWFPSSRVRTIRRPHRSFQKRFVYIGQMSAAKGIHLIAEAIQRMSPDAIFHLYGPISDENCQFIEDQPYYRGVLDPSHVQRTLADYDVLVLPTTYEGEGYPGVLIESFLVGLPCIATNWRSIPEIAQDEFNAKLMKHASTENLIAAMEWFTPSNYIQLSRNAFEFSRGFERGSVSKTLVQSLLSLRKDQNQA